MEHPIQLNSEKLHHYSTKQLPRKNSKSFTINEENSTFCQQFNLTLFFGRIFSYTKKQLKEQLCIIFSILSKNIDLMRKTEHFWQGKHNDAFLCYVLYYYTVELYMFFVRFGKTFFSLHVLLFSLLYIKKYVVLYICTVYMLFSILFFSAVECSNRISKTRSS